MTADVRTLFDDMLDPYDDDTYRDAGRALNGLLGAIGRSEVSVDPAVPISQVVSEFESSTVGLAGEESKLVAYLRRVSNLNPGMKALGRSYPAGSPPAIIIYIFFVIIEGNEASRDTVRVQVALPAVVNAAPPIKAPRSLPRPTPKRSPQARS